MKKKIVVVVLTIVLVIASAFTQIHRGDIGAREGDTTHIRASE